MPIWTVFSVKKEAVQAECEHIEFKPSANICNL